MEQADGWEQPASRRRNPRTAVLLLGATLVAAVLMGRGVGPGGGELLVDPDSSDAPTAPPPTARPRFDKLVAADGPWERLPTGVLTPRDGHTAVWADDRMLVWGGSGLTRFGDDTAALNDGASYRPTDRTWRRLANAPIRGRTEHTAVWTGHELIVWGGRGGGTPFGDGLADGAAYEPADDNPSGSGAWRTLPRAPLAGRSAHTAVWTGGEMIVWGSYARGGPSGAAYDPEADRWRTLPDAPIADRVGHTAVWTGTEMVVWGGLGGGEQLEPLGDGAAYDPVRDRWRGLNRSPLVPRALHTAVWTGREMLVWGGSGEAERDLIPRGDGAAYDPRRDRWHALSGPRIPARFGHAAVWTGSRMLVVGGIGRSFHPDGAAYDPREDEWVALPPAPLRTPTRYPLVWTGRQALLWGGAPSTSGVALTARVGLSLPPQIRPYPR